MRALHDATLSTGERAVLDRFVAMLRERLGDELHAVWLFGSRARGERVDELSDIDLLVVTDRAGWVESTPIFEVLHAAAKAESLPEVAWSFSIHVHDPAWLAGRRAIRSFFIQEVERDHVDLLATSS